MSSIREQAVEIAKRFIGSGDNIEMRQMLCADAIERAIRSGRERCVKILNNARSEPGAADLREMVARIQDSKYKIEP